VGKFFSNPTC
jgi:hypothetical protein